MEIIVCKDYEEMSRRAAELAAEGLRQRPDGLLSFAGGETPLGTVHVFADMVNRREVDISRAHYVSLDEWVGLSNADEGSCGLFNNRELLARLKKPFAACRIINGAAENMEAERDALNAYFAQYGPLTVSVLGVGMNGHLGFNEDGVSFDLDAHIVPLSETTKRVMSKILWREIPPHPRHFPGDSPDHGGGAGDPHCQWCPQGGHHTKGGHRTRDQLCARQRSAKPSQVLCGVG